MLVSVATTFSAILLLPCFCDSFSNTNYISERPTTYVDYSSSSRKWSLTTCQAKMKVSSNERSNAGMNKDTSHLFGNNEIQEAIKLALSNNKEYSHHMFQYNTSEIAVRKNSHVKRLEQQLAHVKKRIISRIKDGNCERDDTIQDELEMISYTGLSNRNNVVIQQIGMEALQIQLKLKYALKPSTILLAVRYLCNKPNAKINAISNSIDSEDKNKNRKVEHSIMAYRLLQRLVSGIGVDNNEESSFTSNDSDKASKSSVTTIREREICTVMNALVRSNKNRVAYRLLVLQERLHASVSNKNNTIAKVQPLARVNVPKTTAIGYSILIKAFGHAQNLSQVESLLTRAHERHIEPDIIFLNSVIDAYISCDAYDRASVVFKTMKNNADPDLQPNIRTYNTIMKGMAKRADVKGALQLSSEMEQLGKHDAVSVNTLVNAMVQAEEFAMAESVLDRYGAKYVNNSTLMSSLSIKNKKRRQQHPHVEAYTELLDGYAKANFPSRAFSIFDKMTERGVTPNEVTYTCLVHALGIAFYRARGRKILLQQQNHQQKEVIEVMYNAYLKGLLSVQKDYSKRVCEAISVFNDMMNDSKVNCRPNAVTTVTVIDGLCKLDNPRVDDAKKLADIVIPQLDDLDDVMKIQTALLKAYGRPANEQQQEYSLSLKEMDASFVIIDEIYKSLNRADIIAMNAYLQACCRFRRLREAFEEFNIAKESHTRQPDVATYTILISALLTRYKDNSRAAKKAQDLYEEMKFEKGIFPDSALVDVILYAMTNGGGLGLTQNDALFTMNVLRDAKMLEWDNKDDYSKRERMVRKVFMGRLSEIWKVNEEEEDGFLRSKGWNQVDSGFKLLSGVMGTEENRKKTDEFLESKGWNDVDSGFRIF